MRNVIAEASAIIFDLEGVLLDTETMWDQAQQKLLSRRGRVYDRAVIKHRITGLGPLQSIAVIIDHYQLADDPVELQRERREIMIEMIRRGVDYVPGALAFVRDAVTVTQVCVGTSMDPALLDVILAQSDLPDHFPGPIFTSAHVAGVAKPAPDLFLYAASRLGVGTEECLVVEDSPNGILAARAANMPCLALCTTHDRDLLGEADVVFSEWAEVPRLSGVRSESAHSRTM
jgi:beta-phosphoglucomutase-like phosphatase (HAD superfamily)